MHPLFPFEAPAWCRADQLTLLAPAHRARGCGRGRQALGRLPLRLRLRLQLPLRRGPEPLERPPCERLEVLLRLP